jgi:hypothetical protein
MKWLRLKTYMLPSIMNEINEVCEYYLGLYNEIKLNEDMSVYNEFIQLRQSVSFTIYQDCCENKGD